MVKNCLLSALAVVIACDAGPGRDTAPGTELAQSLADRRAEVRPPDSMSTAMRAALDRFRLTVKADPPVIISGGGDSRDDLLRRFAQAVERSDTAALIRMTMNRAEFAYLYYPHSIYTHPPYELDPESAWMLHRGDSEKGLTRIIQRFAGKTFEISTCQCAEEPTVEGPNRFWEHCTLTGRIEGAPPTMRWFGSIWERAGHFKFVSYANDL